MGLEVFVTVNVLVAFMHHPPRVAQICDFLSAYLGSSVFGGFGNRLRRQRAAGPRSSMQALRRQ